MAKIYIATAFSQIRLARMHADWFRSEGHEVVSRWHDTEETQEPNDYASRQQIMLENLGDLDKADAVFFDGTGNPRCARVEMGYALAKGKPVGCRGVTDVSDSHPLVTQCEGSLDLEQWIESLTNRGRKDDSGKPPYHLVCWKAFEEVVRVIGFGANKYGPKNYRKVSDFRNRYLSAAFRHLTAWAGGEEKDPESGLHHLAHCICCALFLIEGPDEAIDPPAPIGRGL